MIIDTSAIMAILLVEPEAERFALAIRRAASPRMSAGNHIELIVTAIRRDDPVDPAIVYDTLGRLRIAIAAVDAEQVAIAQQAYLTYGRGRHPARLNFGDCFAYALAKTTGEPLLFKGDDFAHTDVVRAF